MTDHQRALHAQGVTRRELILATISSTAKRIVLIINCESDLTVCLVLSSIMLDAC